jgi:hypothetical protein
MKNVLCLVAIFSLSSRPIDASDEGGKIITSMDWAVFDPYQFECDKKYIRDDYDRIRAVEENENACKRCRNRHAQVAIRNNRVRSIGIDHSIEKVTFEERETILSRIAPKIFKRKFVMTTDISTKKLLVEPNKKVYLTVLKGSTITYRGEIDCPEGCEHTEEHFHWGEKNELPFDEGETIVLGESPFIKSAAKE